MRSLILAGAAFAAQVMTASAVSTDSTGGNSYCNAVQAISLTNFGQADSYQDVVDLNGGCNTVSKSYGGGIAPHDEPVSRDPNLSARGKILTYSRRHRSTSEDL